MDALLLDARGDVVKERAVRGEKEDPPAGNDQHVGEDLPQRAASRGQHERQFGTDVVFIMAEGKGHHAARRQRPFDLRQKLHGKETVELRGGGVGQVHDDHVVFFAGLLDKQASVGVEDSEAAAGQIARKIFPPELQNQRVQFHVIHAGDVVFEDFLGRAGDAAAHQKHVAGVGPLGHGVMHGLLDMLVVVSRSQRHAVLDEIKLAVGFGDEQFAVRGIGPRRDVLPRILPGRRNAVQVQPHRGRHDRDGQDARRGREP